METAPRPLRPIAICSIAALFTFSVASGPVDAVINNPPAKAVTAPSSGSTGSSSGGGSTSKSGGGGAGTGSSNRSAIPITVQASPAISSAVALRKTGLFDTASVIHQGGGRDSVYALVKNGQTVEVHSKRAGNWLPKQAGSTSQIALPPAKFDQLIAQIGLNVDVNTLSTAQKANFTQITGIALGGSTTTPAKGTPPSKSMLESPVVADIANWWRRADFSLIREAHAVDSGGAGIFALVVDLGFAQFSWLSEEAAGSGIDTSRGLYRIDFGPIHAVFASS